MLLNRGKFLGLLFPVFMLVLLAGVFYSSGSPRQAAAQTSTYPVSILTDTNDFNFSLQAQAIQFENGKWTYHFTWNRTRDAQGTAVISPVVNQSVRTAELDPAPRSKTSSSPMVVKLDPATRYVFRFYPVPGCDQASVASDPECVPIRTIYFNTRNAQGQTMSTSEISVSQGGTKIDVLANNSTSSVIPASLSGLSNSELTDIVNKLFAMVQQLIAQISSGSVTTNTTTNTATTTTQTPASNLNGVSCPQVISNFNYDCFVNVFTSNPPTGLSLVVNNDTVSSPNQAVEPQVKEIFDKSNPGPKSSNLAIPSDPNGSGSLITNTKSNPCWTGSSDPYTTCNQNNKFKDGNYREIWVYGTVGRKFSSSFYGPKCDDSNFKIEPTLNIPAGISYNQGCQADSAFGAKIVLGTLSGRPSSAGIYKNEFKVTVTDKAGNKITTLTRIYFMIRPVGNIAVTITPAGAWADPSGKATSVSGEVRLGDRVGIFVNQSPNTTVWNSLDIWAVPGNHVGENPESDSNAASRVFIGTWQGDEGHLICNNSTSGGNDNYQYGCGSFNWLVGDTLSQNLSADNSGSVYTIFVTPHLPYIDRNGQYLARLYGNCEIGYTNCVNFAYGSAKVTIYPSTNSSLPPVTQGVPVASFSQLSISATRDGKTSSIGPGGNDNANVPACSGGNESGGVTCAGPRTSTALKVGQSMNYSWSIKFGDQPGGTAWTSRIFVSNANADQNDLKPGGQMEKLRRCTSGIVPGGFDLNNEAQGFINDWQGSVTISIPADCADILNGARVTQLVNVYVALKGGGSTYATYLMGGLDITK